MGKRGINSLFQSNRKVENMMSVNHGGIHNGMIFAIQTNTNSKSAPSLRSVAKIHVHEDVVTV